VIRRGVGRVTVSSMTEAEWGRFRHLWGWGDDGTVEWVWRWGRRLSRLWVRIHVVGLEHVPANGPTLVVANHRSHADIAALVAAIPRRVTFAATADLLGFPVTRFILETQGCPIVRHAGTDRAALVQSQRILNLGRVLILFPEGGLAPDGPRPFEEGAAYLAVRSGVPVVPAGIAGTRDAWRHKTWWPIRSRQVVVAFGPARTPVPGMARRAATRQLNRELETDVGQLEDLATRIRTRARRGR